jgi:high-affinity nickel permease
VGGLDQLVAGHGVGGSFAAVLFVALVLGFRHASDPDHLVAVSTLVASEPDRPVARAAFLGLSWGLGHATMLAALGMPIVLTGISFPAPLERAGEALIGAVIAALALRLLRRWRRGSFHVHQHAHGPLVHRHLHPHDDAHGADHTHRHVSRSPLQAYAIGILHGFAGSAAIAILLLATIQSRTQAATALVVFALGSTMSMALVSAALGYALGREPLRRRFGGLAPALAAVAFAFGAWYGLQAFV